MIRGHPLDWLVNNHALWQVKDLGVLFPGCPGTGTWETMVSLVSLKRSSQLHAFFLGDRPPPRPGTEDDRQKTLIHLSGSFDFAAKFFQIKSIIF